MAGRACAPRRFHLALAGLCCALVSVPAAAGGSRNARGGCPKRSGAAARGYRGLTVHSQQGSLFEPELALYRNASLIQAMEHLDIFGYGSPSGIREMEEMEDLRTLGYGNASMIQEMEELELDRGSSTVRKMCPWREDRCSCQATVTVSTDAGTKKTLTVACKRWKTGEKSDGTEACESEDLAPEDLGLKTGDGPMKSPKAWRKGAPWRELLGKTKSWTSAEKTCEAMEGQCNNPDLEVAFEGERPMCTVDRLFTTALPEFVKVSGSCGEDKKEQAYELQWELGNSKLLSPFLNKLTQGSLMGCAAISEGCAEPTNTNKILQMAIDNLDAKHVGEWLRNKIMEKAREALISESGIDEPTAQLLLDWAFSHKENNNAYCNKDLMQQHRDMLVRGLTARDPNSKVHHEYPWRYGDDVHQPFERMLTMNVEGMFQADCLKDRPPEVTEQAAREGVGLKIFASDEEKAGLERNITAAVKKRDFAEARERLNELDLKTVTEPLLKFADIPLINATLEYVMRPVLEHPIEANEADLARSALRVLGQLLNDETFYGHLTRQDGSFDGWEMPPELETLWARTKSAKYGERIWPDSLVEKFRNATKQETDCNCIDIESNLALHMLNQLPDIGLDFGTVSRGDNIKGKVTLTSDKTTETLQHVDLEGFARTMIMIESGIQNPKLAAKTLANKLIRSADASGSKSGVPKASSAGKIKGILVGMPIAQNLWAILEKDTTSQQVFALKMKWFFVANIVWAVSHTIEANLPPEDIVLGLLTIVMSTLSNFRYDGQFVVFTNSKPFTDYMLAVYTVWNYRFVKQWASLEQPKEQWMHVSVALSMPLIEALANHGDVSYYINYRRDCLFHAMLLMVEQRAREGKGKCCCDWKQPKKKSGVNYDIQQMSSAQRCVRVQKKHLTVKKECPNVKKAMWADFDEAKADVVELSKDGQFVKLQHDQEACNDISKVRFVEDGGFR